MKISIVINNYQLRQYRINIKLRSLREHAFKSII